MNAAADQAAWARLGEMLERRRAELDPRYRNRTLFCTERGVDYRLVYDIETGSRTNFRRGTLAALEVAYGLPRGSIQRALRGGDFDTIGPPPSTPGQELVIQISEALYRRGATPAQARAFAEDLGLPRRGKLDIDGWKAVADALGLPLGRVLVDFGVVDAGDLMLTSPPRPPVHAVPAAEEALRRA